MILAVVSTLVAINALGTQPGAAVPTVAPASATSEAPSDEPSLKPARSSGSLEPSEPATETPAPTPIAAPDEWTLVHDFGVGSDGWVGGEIAHGAAGFLALGRQRGCCASGTVGPLVLEYRLWLSADGREWTDARYPIAKSGVYFAKALAAASDGSYVLHATHIGGTTIALRSTDGMSWEPVEAGLPGNLDVQAIERGPLGYLLVGGQTAFTSPSLWLSADGLTWELVHQFVQDTHFVQLHDGDAGEEGFVVIGRRIEPGGAYERFTFASGDGRNWVERAEPFGQDPQDYVGDVAVTSLGPDWVATLTLRDDTTSTWTSADGLTWTEAGSIPMRHETIADAGVLAEVGSEVISSPGGGTFDVGNPGVFTTTDATSWSSVDLGADAWLGELAVGDGVVAMTGTVEVDGAIHLAIWIRATD